MGRGRFQIVNKLSYVGTVQKNTTKQFYKYVNYK